MRIGAFEIDCAFHAQFALAEICSGRARLLRSLRLRNVQGHSNEWLKLRAEVGGKRTRQKSVRDLAAGDEDKEALAEREVREALLAPRELGPGVYSARLLVSHEGGEREIPFSFEVLDAATIPTDFQRAEFLAAYLREDDALRAFASDAMGDDPAQDESDALRRLYDALLLRQLRYQPPAATRLPYFQKTSDMAYALSRGGSCADLSLLFASLLWCRGLPPALMLFPDHMAAGQFMGEPPQWTTLDDGPEIARMAEEGALCPVETTAVCTWRQLSFAQAREDILTRLKSGQPCRLVNVARALRSGQVSLIPRVEAAAARCPFCGYNGITAAQLRADPRCPACLNPIPLFDPPAPEAPPEGMEEPEEPLDAAGAAQYALRGGAAAVVGPADASAPEVRVASVWQGRAVRRVAGRAFERRGVTRVILPESVTHIGEYAFYECADLERVNLPPDVCEIGAGAFCGSGIRAVRVPGGVKRIARQTFALCQRLESVELEEGLEVIEPRAFAQCPLLKAVRIPSTVVRIGREAFDPGCELILLSGKTVIDR